MHDKKAFIKSLMNPEPESIEIVQINLDISDITICDILRNFNTVFPENCRDRFEMRDGKKVYTIICKSDYLQPLTGIIILIGKDPDINVECRNYLVLSIDESDIVSEKRINELNDGITRYMLESVAKIMPNFEKFYCRYMYNDYELET